MEYGLGSFRDERLRKGGAFLHQRLVEGGQRASSNWTRTLKRLPMLAGYENLVSIKKGIGARSAAVFRSGIGDVTDFESEDKLAAYSGIVPRVSQSNETDNRGRITKRGNKLIRTTLVQCTLIAIRYSGYLNSFYRRIRERRGAGQAIIAAARQLLKIIYDPEKQLGVRGFYPI